MSLVRVTRVQIPAFSTIGYGEGIDTETGKPVSFAGDHRPMRDVGAAIAVAETEDELPVVDLDEWQVGWVGPDSEGE